LLNAAFLAAGGFLEYRVAARDQHTAEPVSP
jgi:hypothetical protein